MNMKIPFGSADILLPKAGQDKWATIACDQFTSEPEYWNEVNEIVGDAPSCLRITLPEVYLNDPDVEKRIENINAKMEAYMKEGILTEYRDALIFVERTLRDGRVRKGIVGRFCLDDYSYETGTKPLIRTTEGTVLSRIPPRVKIRQNATLELPHVMILMDDRKKNIIEQIDTKDLQVVYDFDLMMGGGHLKGYLLSKKEQDRIFASLEQLAQENNPDPEDAMLFAVGDGNHSLATAKACADMTGHYALAELVNIHDEALDFEPIYRVLFGVDEKDVIAKLKKAFPAKEGKKITFHTATEQGECYVDGLESKVLQDFLDAYVASHSGSEVDYIHGEQSLLTLSQKPNAIGFMFGGIQKDELFPYVKKNGPLPRKTFSMGEAWDKRYYMEAAKIR